MQWININRETLDTEVMLDVEPADGWTWLRLLSYCLGQENGGRIAAAKQWKPRMWMLGVKVAPEDVTRDCALWKWVGDDLMVEFYPHDKEREVVAKRKGGARGAKAKWHKPPSSAKGSAIGIANSSAIGTDTSRDKGSADAEGKGIGKEGNGREEKGTAHAPDVDAHIPSLEEVRDWALGPAGVDPEYAARKWHDTTERNLWVANGRLIDWRARWKRFWEEDREKWIFKKKNSAAGRAAERRPGDADWWWTESLEMLRKALAGALLAGDATTGQRLKEIIEQRKDEK
jgi:hypothetical protein